jgi:hypothetical protein
MVGERISVLRSAASSWRLREEHLGERSKKKFESTEKYSKTRFLKTGVVGFENSRISPDVKVLGVFNG